MLKTFLLALCCAGCVFTLIPQDRPSTPADRDSDSDEVYAAVVIWRTAHPGEGQKAKRLVFSDTTDSILVCGKARGLCNQGKRTANASEMRRGYSSIRITS
jgi:hypothetical protein